MNGWTSAVRVLVVALLLAACAGDDDRSAGRDTSGSGSSRRAGDSGPVDDPTTTSTTTTTTTTTTAPPVAPVSAAEMEALTIPFSAGVAAMPAPCAEYWQEYSYEELGAAAEDNVLEFFAFDIPDPGTEPDNIELADLDGDGITDGVATYYCNTLGGSFPPMTLVVLPAATRRPVTDDGAALAAEHERVYGDSRYRYEDLGVIPEDQPGAGHLIAYTEAFRPEDPNAGGSRVGYGEFAFDDGRLQLVSFEDDTVG